MNSSTTGGNTNSINKESRVQQQQQQQKSENNSDKNANNMMKSDESKGAIPKKLNNKLVHNNGSSKKTNNNLEEIGNNTNGGDDVIKLNGFSKASCSNNYLNSVVFNHHQDVDDDNDSDLERRTNLCGGGSGDGSETVKTANCDYSSRAPINLSINDDYLSFIPLNCRDDDQKKDCESSSDDNEILSSVSDEGYIYTYKGDHAADLPRSFFNLEIPPLEDIPVDGREENSSPEMDFLEMDFDPGPSGDADSDSVSTADVETAASSLPLEEETPAPPNDPQPCCSKSFHQIETPPNNTNPTTSSNSSSPQPLIIKSTSEPLKPPTNLPLQEIKMPWSCPSSQRTRANKVLRTIRKHHGPKGELSPSETIINGEPCLINNANFIKSEDEIENETVMLWSEQEACLKQITQIGPSACGATAVLNVLNALKFPTPTIERVQKNVNTRLRALNSPLTEYLRSRTSAGCTHRDLIRALYFLSEKKVYARFFAMYPERVVDLPKWLGYWIKNGAVPVATLNLQKSEGTVPDSWHHQMIYGIGPRGGVYMINPLECVDATQLWPQLTSESVLLVKTDDVISRWNAKRDWIPLTSVQDVRWKELNVVGQVAKVVRQKIRESPTMTSHIKIPADYKAGITLAIDMSNPAFNLLRQCPELPLLNPEDEASAL